MVKHTQTIRLPFPDELLECAWPFFRIGAERVKVYLFPSKNDREFDYFMIDRKISKWNFFAVFFKRQRKITP